MLGKWRLCPAEEMNMASTKRNNVDIDYAGTSPYAFYWRNDQARVGDVSGDQYVDLEVEALAMMKRA